MIEVKPGADPAATRGIPFPRARASPLIFLCLILRARTALSCTRPTPILTLSGQPDWR